MKVLKSKSVSYGFVQLIDNESTWARYHIEVNGEIKEVSENLNFIADVFERKYY